MVQVADTFTRLQAVKYAREWIGTPYRHQACVKNHACDCIGLIIGVWRDLGLDVPKNFKLPTYTPFWAEETQESLMTDMSREYLIEQDVNDLYIGDIVMYRMSRRAPTKHAAIIVSPNRIVHAYNRNGVVETPFLHGRNVTMTHSFSFPEVQWQHKH